mgnify:CR=1 FL=1
MAASVSSQTGANQSKKGLKGPAGGFSSSSSAGGGNRTAKNAIFTKFGGFSGQVDEEGNQVKRPSQQFAGINALANYAKQGKLSMSGLPDYIQDLINQRLGNTTIINMNIEGSIVSEQQLVQNVSAVLVDELKSKISMGLV